MLLNIRYHNISDP